MATSQQATDPRSAAVIDESRRAEASSLRETSATQPFMDNRVIGWAFLGLIFLLGLCIVFAFIYFIIVSLASPTFLEDYVRTRPDVPAQLALTLEYESRTLKTMGVQIAFGFLVGLVFSAIGVLLFAAGANGTMRLSSTAKWLPLTLTATVPGLAVLLLGGIVIAISVSKDVSRDMTAEMNLGGFSTGGSQPKRTTSATTHDPEEAPRAEPE
jgi:hypothetical protein